MGNVILRDVTPEDVGQQIIEKAGVKPGERVTVVVKSTQALLELADEISRQVEECGFTEEDLAEEVGMKAVEFENLFGRKPNRPLP